MDNNPGTQARKRRALTYTNRSKPRLQGEIVHEGLAKRHRKQQALEKAKGDFSKLDKHGRPTHFKDGSPILRFR